MLYDGRVLAFWKRIRKGHSVAFDFETRQNRRNQPLLPLSEDMFNKVYWYIVPEVSSSPAPELGNETHRPRRSPGSGAVLVRRTKPEANSHRPAALFAT